jgi:MYXO-CTERM domain-containing protein
VSQHRDADRPARVTPADIEGKLRQIHDEVERTGEAAKGPGMVVAAVAAVALLAVVFLLGRRRGRKTRTVVEIRRL